MEFGKVLGAVSTFFQREGFAFAVIGAFALQAYGLSRATYDLDFVTDMEAQPKLVPFLESLGYETVHRSTGYSNHLHGNPSFGRVDFVYVSGETSRKLFAQSGASLELGGVSVAVPRPEHLAAMKIHAMKNDPQRIFQEMADVQFILGLPETDEQEIRSYFEESGQLDLYDEIKRRL